jgi:hypothetical protein
MRNWGDTASLARCIPSVKLDDIETTELNDRVLFKILPGSVMEGGGEGSARSKARSSPSDRVVSLLEAEKSRIPDMMTF